MIISPSRTELSTLERRKQAREFYHTLLGLLDNDPSCKDTYELLLCQGEAMAPFQAQLQ